MVGWWVLPLVCGKLLLEAKIEFAGIVQAGIGVSHSGQCLSHGMNGFFHCARADRILESPIWYW